MLQVVYTFTHDHRVSPTAFGEGRFGGVNHVFLNAGYETKLIPGLENTGLCGMLPRNIVRTAQDPMCVGTVSSVQYQAQVGAFVGFGEMRDAVINRLLYTLAHIN